jgi:hypothetical protein
LCGRGVETCGRFVEKQDARCHNQRSSDVESTMQAAGIAPDLAVCCLLQLESREQLA